MSSDGEDDQRELDLTSQAPDKPRRRIIEEDVDEEDENDAPGAADDAEDDAEDDEDDDDIGTSRKRRRTYRGNQFIDMEAEVDDEDEEEPEEEDDLPGDEVHPDDEGELPEGAYRDDRLHKALDRERDLRIHADAEAEAQRLKERYGRQNYASERNAAITDQRLLMPTADDPRIFRMKCRPGHEREIIAAVQQRTIDRMDTKEPLKIISVFAREGAMSGNLYFEARIADHILPAVDGISHVFMGTKPMMIAQDEMPDLLHTKKSKQLEPGMYVRVKRGLYSGDLAQVEEIEANNVDVIVKLVPRLDYGLTDDQIEATGGVKRKRPISMRPPQKMFSESEAKKKHSRYLQRIQGLSNNSWQYQGKDYINGMLVETFKINALQTENINPTLEEVTKFAADAEDGTENLDLAALAATLKASTASDFLPGDKVEIFKGEQKGVTGKAIQVYGEVVRIQVTSGSLAGKSIEAPVADLRKLFGTGDHVKVVGGSKYYDEVGMVVKIRDDRVTLLTDANNTEITVFSKDLREASDSGGSLASSKYTLFDLVQLDVSTVGCIIKVDRESITVLDQTGSVRSLLPSNIANKIDRRPTAIATDHDGNEIKLEDTIREYSGEQKTGRVLHMHRNFLFAQNRERAENAGVFVARSANVVTVAAKGGRVGNGGIDLTKMNPAMRQNGTAQSGVMLPPQSRGRDQLIGKTVRIALGPQKGMIGIVKDTTEEKATVELHAKNKKVQVDKTKLKIVDPLTGKEIDDRRGLTGIRPMNRAPQGSMPSYAGGRTPAYAMATGGRTPSWKQDAARTPAYGGGTAYGGQTSYGGGTAYGGQTSYGGGTAYGGQTSYGGGSVWGGSGAYNAGGRTPYGGLDAPTPGLHSAPTPGNYDQPTPGAYAGQYQTPANYQTPAGFPATPAAFTADTPANDGPGYD